jgi:hypothetical protein
VVEIEFHQQVLIVVIFFLPQTIAGIAVALKQAADPAFKTYAKQVVTNARAIAKVLSSHDYKLQTDGTDNHLVLWDLRPLGLTGSKVEKICDECHITVNKNAVSGDTSAQVPGGVRVGLAALTSRSMTEEHMDIVADFLHRAVQIALQAQKEAGTKLLKDFVTAYSGNGEASQQLAALKKDVVEFATKFPLPGVPDTVSLESMVGVIECKIVVADEPLVHFSARSPPSSDPPDTKRNGLRPPSPNLFFLSPFNEASSAEPLNRTCRFPHLPNPSPYTKNVPSRPPPLRC